MDEQIPDHVKPFLNEKYYFDHKKAQLPILFIENFLYFFDGQFAGQPFRLMKWQKELIEKTYGILRKDNGLRRYKTVYCLVPRKNSKSTTVAAILLYELVCNPSLSAQNYLASNARSQASYLLNIIKGLVAASPTLRKTLTIQKNKVINPKTNSFIETVSREGTTLFGSNPSSFCYDEITFSPASDLYNSLATGQGAQVQPLAFLIGTASPSKSNWGYEMFEYAKKINKDPSLNENFLSIIYAAEEEDDWESETVWQKCNPSLGTTITIDYLREEYQKTKAFPSSVPAFRLFYLNQFVDSEDIWIESETWKKCSDENINMTDFENQPCWLGVDLSSTNDLSVIVVVFEIDGILYVFPKFFVPYNSLETKMRVHKVDYVGWNNGGHITATTGNGGLVVDYGAMTDYIHEVASHHDIQSIYIDPWSSAAFINMLQTDYMSLLVMTRQGFATMGKLVTETEKLIIAGKIKHPNNPCLNWNMENVVLEIDGAGNPKISKKKSVSKVDGAVAMVMAVGGAFADLYLEESEAEVLFI